MDIPTDPEGVQADTVPSEPSFDTIFDPGASFGAWFGAVDARRNHRPSAPLPGFCLENGDWEFEEPAGDNDFTECFRSEGSLVVNTHGKLEGNVEVTSAVIDGIFKGKITATENVVLENHAVVVGEIHTPTLEIHGGAIIEGTCHFETPKPEPTEPPAWELIKVGLSKVWRGRIAQ